MLILLGLIILGTILYFKTKKTVSASFTPKNHSNKSEEGLPKIISSHDNFGGSDGTEEHSPDKNYCVSFIDGYENNGKWENGTIILLHHQKILFRKSIQRPNDCHVSNDGIVICCDWQNTNALSGRFIIFNSLGEQIFTNKISANLGVSSISENSEYAIFESHYSETDDGSKIFIVDVKKKSIIHKIERPTSFNRAIIDSVNKRISLIDHRNFNYEIDFEGNHINKAEYEDQIMKKGSIYDLLIFFDIKNNENKFQNERYLETLLKSLYDEDSLYAFGKDKIYRKIGECYEWSGDKSKAIENWEMAIALNPKVGIKRKLDQLKSSI
jgi:hypothetical protein